MEYGKEITNETMHRICFKQSWLCFKSPWQLNGSDQNQTLVSDVCMYVLTNLNIVRQDVWDWFLRDSKIKKGKRSFTTQYTKYRGNNLNLIEKIQRSILLIK